MENATLHGSLAALGIGLSVIGAGYGIGRLASAALEGMARQPEASNRIQAGMIVAIAFIEGLAIIAIGICYMLKQ